MERYIYEAVFTPMAKGGYEVEFPELGIFTQGTNLADAAYMANDALTLELVDRIKAGENPALVGKFGADRPEGGAVMAVMAVPEAQDELQEMTPQEAADLLGVSRPRIYAMAKSGILQARKIGGAVMITTDSVKARINAPGKVGRPAHKGVLAQEA